MHVIFLPINCSQSDFSFIPKDHGKILFVFQFLAYCNKVICFTIINFFFRVKIQVSDFNCPICNQVSVIVVVESERSRQHKKQAANKDLCARGQPMGRAKITYKEENSVIVRHVSVYSFKS